MDQDINRPDPERRDRYIFEDFIMNRFSKIIFAATALVATVAGAAPSFAAVRADNGYHWEYTPGPRSTPRRVADRVAEPNKIANEAGHWRVGAGPRGTVRWIPGSPANSTMAIERMASTAQMPKGS